MKWEPERKLEGKLPPLSPSLFSSIVAKKATLVVVIAFFFGFGFVTVKKATIASCRHLLFFVLVVIAFFFAFVVAKWKKKKTIAFVTFFDGFAVKNGDENYRHLF